MAEDNASITVDGTEDDLRALGNWLRDEDDLRGRVRLDSAPIEEGQMGAVLDAVVVVLTSATAGTLIRSVKDWLIATRNAKKVTLKLTSKDGGKLELSVGSAEDAEAALDAARKFLGE
ncbi:hypothetical protein ALI144C_49340 [Actinosynnema sp. ALI-1.44]|uniref:effector-associated constant component EACC1 n=1 Tax=Actinosynnema sp. ALI-1.44 TaxID=1933779 RepID=UPI00097C1674|nr:hypothetical protein [Actinosynnema sp. ALI-1.44]ONI70631.1 hypothetical protein ALI144C_49340 [Actinosynnema sp. ALI-1.44]